ncbi:hypothetical protein NECAME_06056 [Necator americanus]|uniref:Uncharacterized protein n=1 Tax=Necator americanus TaxID=51031 RepID=W2TVQ5_NECAM|nr:hypothetical protein NECAME_06056 [Necator americanus]ETN86175.1 hypothetical protein NECAME_06056 [Necator americanus]
MMSVNVDRRQISSMWLDAENDGRGDRRIMSCMRDLHFTPNNTIKAKYDGKWGHSRGYRSISHHNPSHFDGLDS